MILILMNLTKKSDKVRQLETRARRSKLMMELLSADQAEEECLFSLEALILEKIRMRMMTMRTLVQKMKKAVAVMMMSLMRKIWKMKLMKMSVKTSLPI